MFMRATNGCKAATPPAELLVVFPPRNPMCSRFVPTLLGGVFLFFQFSAIGITVFDKKLYALLTISTPQNQIQKDILPSISNCKFLGV